MQQYLTKSGQPVRVTSDGVRVLGKTHSSNPHVPAERWYVVARPTNVEAYAAKKLASGEWVRPAGATAPQQPEPRKDYRVVAVLSGTDERVACTKPLTWDAAQGAWNTLDNQWLKGHMPHVRYYAVRSVDDPQWQGLRLDANTLVPHAHQPMPAQRPTGHQAEVLDRLVRRSTGGLAPQRVAGVLVAATELRWVKETSVGSPMGLYHLYRKGYAELDVRVGPRGGEHNYYRPTNEGVAYAARRRVRQLKVVAAG